MADHVTSRPAEVAGAGAVADGAGWPPGESEMARRMRAHDWAATPLGPPAQWPPRLQAAVELMLASPLVSSLVCGPQRLLLYNDAAARLYGERHPAALGRPLPQTFPEGWPVVENLYARAFAGEPVHVPAQPLAVPGNPAAVFDAYLTPLRDAPGHGGNTEGGGEGVGEAAWVHMCGCEIGARVAAESLREREAVLRALFEATDEAVLVIERAPTRSDGQRDWRCVAMNTKASAMFGTPAVAGRSMREHLLREDEAWYDIFDSVMRSGAATRFEREALAPRRALEAYVARVTEERAPHLLVVLRDVTARRRAREALERSEARQHFMLRLEDRLRPLADPLEVMATASEALGRHLHAGRCGYAELDSSDTFLVVEREWTDGAMPSGKGHHRAGDFGEQVVAASRAGHSLVIHDTHTDPRTREAAAAFDAVGGLRASLSVALVKNGRWVASFYVQESAPRHWSDDDEALVREVAERTWAAVERARAEAALREADARKDEFLATLAHELRNPLAPIRSALLLLRTEPPAAAAALRSIIERQVEHMVRLVDDLLDVARISHGVIELRREPLDLRSVLRTAVETSRPAIERGRHALTLELTGEHLGVEGDAVRLAQIFANLLNNASKYSDDGRPIVLSAWREGSEALVAVRDRGIGIAAHDLPHVFELFSQIDRGHPRAQGGLGIGLHLAQRLVAMHGGSLRAESAGPGQGSVFTVRLPLAGEDEAAAPDAAAGGAQDLRAHRLLVVDDNRDAAQTLAALLQLLGAQTRVAHDGAAALAELSAVPPWRPTAVLLDLGMPGMDGFEVARRIRADSRLRTLALIALTGWGQQADRQRTRAAGFDHHLTKPVAMEVLLRALRAGRAPVE